MARVQLASLGTGVAQNRLGSVIAGASGTIYLHGTTTPVNVYAAEVGGSPDTSGVFTTDLLGKIPGWVEAGTEMDITIPPATTITTVAGGIPGADGVVGDPGVGANWLGVWSSGTSYSIGDGVYRSGVPYISNANTNLNNDPASDDGSNWGRLYQYPSLNIKTFGAKGDGKLIGSGTISSGSATLTISPGSFVAGDVGKAIYVPGAAAAGADLLTTIAAFTSSTVVTLAVTAGTTATGVVCVYGSDDTAAIQDAIDYLAANHGGTVFFPRGIYCVSGGFRSAPTYGSAAGKTWNAQLALPFFSGSANRTVFEFQGEKVADYDATVPDPTGSSIICSLSTGGTYDATKGVPCLLGSNWPSASAAENNLHFSTRRITYLCPSNPNLTALNFKSLLGARWDDTFVGTHQGWNANIQPTHPHAVGIYGPTINNYGGCGGDGYVGVTGYYCGISLGEHTHIPRLGLFRNYVAIQPDLGGHWWTAGNVSAEHCTYMLAGVNHSTGVISPTWLSYFKIGQMDLEDDTADWTLTTTHVLDAGHKMHGSVAYWRSHTTQPWTVSGGNNLCDYEALFTRHQLGGPGEPAYQNSWTGAPSLAEPGWMKDASGVIHLSGAATGGAINTVIGTLPAYFAPATYTEWPVGSTGANKLIEVAPNGDITSHVSGTASAWVSLDGINFRARIA